MRIQMILAGGAALALIGCSEAGKVDDPSDAGQMEAAMAAMAKPTPGEYSTTSNLVEFDMPGVPEQDQQMMRGIMEMASGQETKFCLTEEMAEAGYKDYIKTLQSGADNCEYTSFDASGGKLEAKMECKDPSGGEGTIAFSGTIGETEQNMTVIMDMSDPASGQGMKMTLENATKRIGDCPA